MFFIFLFRLGTLITLPGIVWKDNPDTGIEFLSTLAALGGGVLSRFSFFAVGISPFITASILVQLLSTGLIPALMRWTKQGRKGQVKLNYLTKLITVPLGYVQALGIIFALEQIKVIEIGGVLDKNVYKFFFCPIVLLGGTMITLLFADLISSKGIGQGTSVIIFTGILAVIPGQLIQELGKLVSSPQAILLARTSWIILSVATYFLILFFLIVLIVYFQNAERRIPVQQTGSGLRLKQQEKSYLPLKLNPSGVIPVIFASTFFSLFGAISKIIAGNQSQSAQNFVAFADKFLSFETAAGIAFFALFVFLFTLLYAHISINSEQLSKNFQQSGSYIPGILPGQNTMNYVSRIVSRVSLFGAIYLAFLASFSFLVNRVLFEEQISGTQGINLGISGTSILILVLIGENILRQIQDLRIQSRYIDLRSSQKDIFLW